ncbi:hypothetical protein Y032_0017g3478 [Ancylostoma ceylanicum]|uniref:Uncharacterized protein n=1 Tax=Ancylostoma ceylanicum TaxID=53326 RepID=A0A016V5E8_9BILA|nr:hypothetical protein Y032_0017g3478 [Ancylostoma ceylanicum]
MTWDRTMELHDMTPHSLWVNRRSIDVWVNMYEHSAANKLACYTHNKKSHITWSVAQRQRAVPVLEMSQIMFSDDDDVSKHAAELERIHEAISVQESPSTTFDADDCKENQSSCPFIDGDPIYRRILHERKRPLRDVFILPFVPPSNTHDEYEFGSDQEYSNERNDCSTSDGSRPPSTESCDAGRSTPSRRSHSSLSASSTPLLDRRRRRRLQKLRDAVIATRATASDDDQEFVPGLATFESLLEDQETLTMKLRPRKGFLFSFYAISFTSQNVNSRVGRGETFDQTESCHCALVSS